MSGSDFDKQLNRWLGGHNGPRVVIADDDERFRRLLAAILTAAGIEVREAANGTEALDLVKRWQPDAIVLDWLMPSGGLGLARVLIDEYDMRDRVILVSALSDRRDQLEALKAGVADYFVKPPDADELVRAIRGAAQRRR